MASARVGSDAIDFGDSITQGGYQKISWNGVLWKSNSGREVSVRATKFRTESLFP